VPLHRVSLRMRRLCQQAVARGPVRTRLECHLFAGSTDFHIRRSYGSFESPLLNSRTNVGRYIAATAI
jgi:hypothetical protein